MDGKTINNVNPSFSLSFGIERTEPAESHEASPPSSNEITTTTTTSQVASQMHVNDMKRLEHTGGHLQYSDEHFMKLLNRAFKALDGRNTNVQFMLHDKTNQFVIKVMDKDTGELIREIPPEKSLDFLAKVQEMLGLIVDVRR